MRELGRDDRLFFDRREETLEVLVEIADQAVGQVAANFGVLLGPICRS